METQDSVQSPLHKLFFHNSCQNLRKNRYQSFQDFLGQFCLIFLLLAMYFVPDCRFRITLNIIAGRTHEKVGR